MTENFNPYQPPLKSARQTNAGKKLTFIDWVLAIVLGVLALIVTFFSTCMGVVISFWASDSHALIPVALCFCFLFAAGIAYSAAANYLALRARQLEGSAPEMKSFQLQRSYRKPTELDKLLTGYAAGLLALTIFIPSIYFLLDQLSETMRFSPETSENTQGLGHVGSVALSLIAGWWCLRRVSSR